MLQDHINEYSKKYEEMKAASDKLTSVINFLCEESEAYEENLKDLKTLDGKEGPTLENVYSSIESTVETICDLGTATRLLVMASDIMMEKLDIYEGVRAFFQQALDDEMAEDGEEHIPVVEPDEELPSGKNTSDDEFPY